MSGFEVVGVVLGVVPLLISGLEHYNEGLVPIKDMLKYKYVVKELVRALNVARCRLRITCETLLTGLVDDEELAMLLSLDSLGGDAWKRPDLDRKLQERLDESYEGYMETIAHLAGLMFTFAKKMGLNSKFRPTWIEKPDNPARNSIFGHDLKRKSAKLWKRVKLGLDHEEFHDLIKEMAHENLQLELLTRGNLELEPIRRQRNRDLDVKHWKGIREFAMRLYSSLLSRWPCKCGVPHQASLRLDIRSSPNKSEKADIKFEVVFAFSDNESPTAPWKWRNTEIKGVKITSQEGQSLLTARPSQGRSVSFGAPPSPPPSRAQSPPSPPMKSAKIKDLCSALARDDAGPCCLGYLDDEQWQHHVYLSKGQAPVEWPAKSLHQILSRGSNLQSVIITPKDRYELALLLSSTLLQLHNTPWLNDNWTRDDIYLLQGWSEKSLAKNIYVSKTFSPPQTNAAMQTDPDLPLLRNVSVFNLGLALLELTFGHPIEYYETEADLRNGVWTVMTNRLIAERLIGKIETYEGKRYSDVVYRCVYCDFGSRVTSFENDEFRQNFYAGVVQPLAQILDDFVK
ncbi:hypothetical protein G7Y89_g5493 [Cudoniella acicularis]|uniref:DUF7580 domain-containing protein n=1 Tax=Cudoniella acicularis TaxID=354080 RepID=A0A8H4RME9_9HELO|nr:hypothetical protein G7Y89_g5493 [Cudoniella acicularis]